MFKVSLAYTSQVPNQPELLVRPCLTIYEVRAHLRGVQYARFGDDHESLFSYENET